jgi:hypothetical protein
MEASGPKVSHFALDARKHIQTPVTPQALSSLLPPLSVMPPTLRVALADLLQQPIDPAVCVCVRVCVCDMEPNKKNKIQAQLQWVDPALYSLYNNTLLRAAWSSTSFSLIETLKAERHL